MRWTENVLKRQGTQTFPRTMRNPWSDISGDPDTENTGPEGPVSTKQIVLHFRSQGFYTHLSSSLDQSPLFQCRYCLTQSLPIPTPMILSRFLFSLQLIYIIPEGLGASQAVFFFSARSRLQALWGKTVTIILVVYHSLQHNGPEIYWWQTKYLTNCDLIPLFLGAYTATYLTKPYPWKSSGYDHSYLFYKMTTAKNQSYKQTY